MSYLENGSTHRSMFRLMPPLHHDVDPNRSQVVAYIMENTGWEVGRAVAAFNSMRNPRSRVLVFDKVHRVWKGCDWMPPKDEGSHQMILAEHRALERRVIAMDAELRKATREIEKLIKQVANLNELVVERGDGNERIRAAQKAACEGLKKRENPANQMAANVAAAWS